MCTFSPLALSTDPCFENTAKGETCNVAFQSRYLSLVLHRRNLFHAVTVYSELFGWSLNCLNVEHELLYTSSIEGTAVPLACPEGRFSNSSGLRVPEDCRPCLGGFYCQSVGITEPNGPCSGGYGFL